MHTHAAKHGNECMYLAMLLQGYSHVVQAADEKMTKVAAIVPAKNLVESSYLILKNPCSVLPDLYPLDEHPKERIGCIQSHPIVPHGQYLPRGLCNVTFEVLHIFNKAVGNLGANALTAQELGFLGFGVHGHEAVVE